MLIILLVLAISNKHTIVSKSWSLRNFIDFIFCRNRKSRRDWYCDVCGAYLRSINGILEGDRVVTCAKCQTRVCKNRCSKLTEATEWICKNCLNSPESWFQTVLATLQLYKTGKKLHKDTDFFWLVRLTIFLLEGIKKRTAFIMFKGVDIFYKLNVKNIEYLKKSI